METLAPQPDRRAKPKTPHFQRKRRVARTHRPKNSFLFVKEFPGRAKQKTHHFKKKRSVARTHRLNKQLSLCKGISGKSPNSKHPTSRNPLPQNKKSGFPPVKLKKCCQEWLIRGQSLGGGAGLIITQRYFKCASCVIPFIFKIGPGIAPRTQVLELFSTSVGSFLVVPNVVCI